MHASHICSHSNHRGRFRAPFNTWLYNLTSIDALAILLHANVTAARELLIVRPSQSRRLADLLSLVVLLIATRGRLRLDREANPRSMPCVLRPARVDPLPPPC